MRSVTALIAILVRHRFSRAGRVSRKHLVRRERQFWVDAANSLGLATRRVGDGRIQVQLADGHNSELIEIEVHGSSTDARSLAAPSRGGDREVLYDLLAEQDVPVMPHRVFTIATMSDAARFLDLATSPCVVRPVRRTSVGDGVSIDVTDMHSLRVAAGSIAAMTVAGDAFDQADRSRLRARISMKNLSSIPLMIELRADGDAYRLLYLDGELLDAVQRTVTVGSEKPYRPARHLLHDDVVEEAGRASGAVEGRLVGVEVVAMESVSPSHIAGRVVDVVEAPGLSPHYHGWPGTVDVARTVLERLGQA